MNAEEWDMGALWNDWIKSDEYKDTLRRGRARIRLEGALMTAFVTGYRGARAVAEKKEKKIMEKDADPREPQQAELLEAVEKPKPRVLSGLEPTLPLEVFTDEYMAGYERGYQNGFNNGMEQRITLAKGSL